MSRETERFEGLIRRIEAASPVGAKPGLTSAEAEALSRVVAPKRVLVAGPGAGPAAVMLLMMFPEAQAIAIDGETGESVADTAARLEVRSRLHVETGGFANAPRGGRAAGQEIVAQEPDFDLILLDGAPEAAARAADLRLAASAVAPKGVIAMRGLMGRSAATVRAGVFDFLRFNPGFHYLAAADAQLGLLRQRPAGWFPGFPAPVEVRPGDVTGEMLEGLGRQIAQMAGNAPIVEVAVGAPMLGLLRATRDGDAVIELSPTEVAVSYVDPLIERISSALEAPGAVLFSGDLADFASDELMTRLFDRLGDRNGAAILCVTPPGEAVVAGLAARPAARVIDLAASQQLTAYAPAGLEFETLRHADARAAVSSRHLSLLMFARSGGRRDGAGRSLVERTPAAAAQHEQVELQRLMDQAAMRAEAETHARIRAEAESRGQDLERRLHAATRAADIAVETHTRARSAWDAESLGLREELRTQTSLAGALKAALDDATSALARERDLRTRLETEIEALRRSTEEELRLAGEQHHREAEGLRGELAGAMTELARLRAELSKAQHDIAEGADEVRTLQGALKSLGESDRRLQARLEDIEALKAKHAQVMQGSERELSRLRVTLADEASRATRLMSDLQAAQAEAAAAKADAARLAGDLAAATELQEELSAEHEMMREGHAQGVAALVDARAEAQRFAAELQGLRDAEARRGETEAGLRREIIQLQQRQGEMSAQLIDQACREVELHARLRGLDAHIALSQEAVDRAKVDPEGYRVASQTYPTDGADAVEGKDIVGAIHGLHGRAADLSHEIGAELEAAEIRRRATLGDVEPTLDVLRASHEQALAQVKADASQTERRLLRVDDMSRSNERALRAIETVAFGEAQAPSATDDVEERMRLFGERLERVLHKLEAGEPAPKPIELKAEPKVEPKIEPKIEPRPEPVVEVRRAEPPAPRDELLLEPSPEASSDIDAEPQQRKVIDDLTPPPLGEPDKRGFIGKTWDWLRAYRETYSLVRVQRTLDASFKPRLIQAKAFDREFYRLQGGVPAGQDALQHYILVGEAQGRRPLANFDPAFYRDQLNGEKVQGSLLRHFLETGVDEGKSPTADLEPLPRRAMASGVSRLEYFFRREMDARKQRKAAD